MDLDKFQEVHARLQAQASFTEYDKLVVSEHTMARIVGDFASNFEHFVPVIDPNKPNAALPFYCTGPKNDCPLCKVSVELRADPITNKKEWGDKIRAKERFYFNVLDRSPGGRLSHTQTKHTKLLAQSKNANSVGSMIFQNLGGVVEMLQKQKPGDKDWPNPIGYDVIIMRQGKDLNTKYPVHFSGDRSLLTPEEQAYVKYDVLAIAKITDRATLDRVAAIMKTCRPLSSTEVPGGTGKTGDTSFNPAALEGAVQQPLPQPQQFTQQVTQPTQPPPLQMPPVQPQGMPQGATQTATLTAPFVDPNMQDTNITQPYDETKHMKLPCTNCSSPMYVNMKDQRRVKCWSCGSVYASPAPK